jgi:hypothetical protein
MLPGVYLTVTGSATVDQREMAALLYAGRYSTITGLAALRRFGLTVPATSFTDVLVPRRCGKLARGYIRLHRTDRVPARVAEQASIQFALIPRAAIDAALCMTSVRDIRGLTAGLVQQSRCSVEQLEAELGHSRLRNSASLRIVLAEVTDGARSSPEADLMNLIKGAGLPTPLYNPRLYVGKDFLASPDLWWKERGVAAEVDSREWHTSPEAWEGTMSRHDRMVAAGIRVLHFTPRTIRAEPAEVVSLIRSALRTGTPVPGIRTVPAATREGRTD